MFLVVYDDMVWIHGQDDKEPYLEKAFIVNDFTTFSDNLH